MGGKDKEKQSSRNKKSGTSSSSHRKQSSSSSSNAKTSSSRKDPTSRTARDTHPPETPYENENEDEEEEEDEPEDDHPPQSREGREEGYPDVTYIGPSVQTGYAPRQNQPEQTRNQAPQYAQPPESIYRRADARAYTTSSQGQQTPSYYQQSYAQPTGTQQTPSYYQQSYAQPTGAEQTPPYYQHSYAPPTGTQRTPSYYSASSAQPTGTQRTPSYYSTSSSQPTGTQQTPSYYPTSSSQPTGIQQTPYYSASSAQPTGTQQTPGRPGATSRPYSSTPGYDTTRSSEGTTSGGQYSAESAAGTGMSNYSHATQDPSRSSYSLATAATSLDSRQGADPRTRPWQEVQQQRPAESWDQRGNEQKTIDDEYNRIGNEDDDTGS